MGRSITLAVGLLVLAGCADEGAAGGALTEVTGQVILGPQCPVEIADDPCPDQPAGNVTVTVSEQIPGDSYTAGDEVARATTDADGTYRMTVAPGDYVVSANAGMSCELMDARLTDRVATVDILCDIGIR